MKLFRNVFIVLAMLFSVQSKAQQLKFGHINSADLLDAMPDVKLADTALAKYQKELEDSYNFLVNEYQTKLDDYQKNKATWTETIRGLKEQELQDLQDKINQFQSDSQDKFASKKQELYAPILKKADDAVKAVAKENGYSYVFDTSAGAVLYAWDSDDLMALVKKKLGLQ